MALLAPLNYYCQLTKSGAGVTGKAGSLTFALAKVVRGASLSASQVSAGGGITISSITEMSSSNQPGCYGIGFTGLDASYDYFGAFKYTGTASDVDLIHPPTLQNDPPTVAGGAVPQAAAGAANGLVICGANAATTFATLTVTGAFSINGTGNVAQTGDAYAIVADSSFGNAKLVRSTVPANTFDVSATGEGGLDFNNIKDATGAHTLTNITVPLVTLASTVTTLTNLPSIPANWLTSTGIASGALNGKGDWASVSAIVNGVLDEPQINHLAAGSIGSYIDGKTSTAISNTAKLPASYTVGSTASAPVFTAAVLINAPSGGLTQQQTADAMLLPPTGQTSSIFTGVTAAAVSSAQAAINTTGGGTAPTVEEIDTQLSVTHGNGLWGSGTDGEIAVNHNTGGVDSLRYEMMGIGINNAKIRAYLKSEYDVGTRQVRAESLTGSDGRWVQDMMLQALTYVITFDADGYLLAKVEVTVAS